MTPEPTNMHVPDRNDSERLPFWAMPQYGGGVVQGMGIALASLFLVNFFSQGFFERNSWTIGAIGILLIAFGGIRARSKG